MIPEVEGVEGPASWQAWYLGDDGRSLVGVVAAWTLGVEGRTHAG